MHRFQIDFPVTMNKKIPEPSHPTQRDAKVILIQAGISETLEAFAHRVGGASGNPGRQVGAERLGCFDGDQQPKHTGILFILVG